MVKQPGGKLTKQICTCVHCSAQYVQNPRVKNQRYCSCPECQRERKSLWHKQKLQTDVAYKQNRFAAQQKWQEKHPDYWRNYRKTHPKSSERNRILQIARNKKARCIVEKDMILTDTIALANASMIAKTEAPVIAKTDALTDVISGAYWLVPVVAGMIAKTDALKIQLSVISRGYDNASDCKDRTR